MSTRSLWETLPQELDYEILFSQRGVLDLAHDLHDVRETRRRVFANRLNGIDAEWLEPDDVRQICPIVDVTDAPRYPVLGAAYQPRAGIAKHDHVAWAYARAADALGVDLIQNAEVTGFLRNNGRVTGVRTTRDIAAGRVCLVAAGHTKACWPGWSDCACRSSRTRSGRSSPSCWSRSIRAS